ncbi:MAG: T9SS type A sorting domain-containing protein, partial [Calditrichaeota bacterium]|nr:T9SS type A sorting domain-containing protein [Calditrichota bacterium]
FIYAYKDKQWQRLNSQVFSNTQRVVAYVNELTSYKLAVDPNFTGSNLVPEQYNLLQNYPNPFNPSTTIQYDLASDAIVRIVIYNMLGQKVRTLLNQFELAGSAKKIVWDGKNDAGQRVVSGIYIYQLNTATFSQSKKMVLIK